MNVNVTWTWDWSWGGGGRGIADGRVLPGVDAASVEVVARRQCSTCARMYWGRGRGGCNILSSSSVRYLNWLGGFAGLFGCGFCLDGGWVFVITTQALILSMVVCFSRV